MFRRRNCRSCRHNCKNRRLLLAEFVEEVEEAVGHRQHASLSGRVVPAHIPEETCSAWGELALHHRHKELGNRTLKQPRDWLVYSSKVRSQQVQGAPNKRGPTQADNPDSVWWSWWWWWWLALPWS